MCDRVGMCVCECMRVSDSKCVGCECVCVCVIVAGNFYLSNYAQHKSKATELLPWGQY